MMSRPTTAFTLLALLMGASLSDAADRWEKRVIDEGRHTTNVVAADFTGDGKVDVMANSDGATRLFVGPGVANVTALLAVFLPGLSLAAWSFGQLPTILATGVVLLALARGAAFGRTGRPQKNALLLAAGVH